MHTHTLTQLKALSPTNQKRPLTDSPKILDSESSVQAHQEVFSHLQSLNTVWTYNTDITESLEYAQGGLKAVRLFPYSNKGSSSHLPARSQQG